MKSGEVLPGHIRHRRVRGQEKRGPRAAFGPDSKKNSEEMYEATGASRIVLPEPAGHESWVEGIKGHLGPSHPPGELVCLKYEG